MKKYLLSILLIVPISFMGGCTATTVDYTPAYYSAGYSSYDNGFAEPYPSIGGFGLYGGSLMEYGNEFGGYGGYGYGRGFGGYGSHRYR